MVSYLPLKYQEETHANLKDLLEEELLTSLLFELF